MISSKNYPKKKQEKLNIYDYLNDTNDTEYEDDEDMPSSASKARSQHSNHTTRSKKLQENNSTEKQQVFNTADKIQSRIPAIKFTIAHEVATKYQNQIELTNEINRCHQHINRKLIKFASIRENLVIIATDDQRTYDQLSKTWPTDAFTKGIRFRQQKESTTQERPKQIIIKGVHKQINIEEPEILEQLKEQGLINPKRISNKSNEATTLLKAEVSTVQKFDSIISNGIFIGYIRCKAEPARTITQCFKCQRFGHTHFNCTGNAQFYK